VSQQIAISEEITLSRTDWPTMFLHPEAEWPQAILALGAQSRMIGTFQRAVANQLDGCDDNKQFLRNKRRKRKSTWQHYTG